MAMVIKSRIFNVAQFEKHPKTGEILLSEERIKKALAHRTIKRWAYIKHDKDIYTEDNEQENSLHKANTLKPPHWHIAIEMGSNQIELSTIAKWFGIKNNFVEVVKGAGAFLNIVQYLTHEGEKQQELGKRLYSDDEVRANFDFRGELNKRAERKARYGRDLNERDRLRNKVLFHGMTLRQVIEDYPLQYQSDYKYLENCRIRYISTISKMPKVRINFYVEGRGGIGKGLISKAIARALIDPDGVMKDEDIFFEVGADKTSFEGYDGQPVLIWNDCRAGTLLHKLGGRENVFNVFDLFPPDIKQNIKYGSVRLNNIINIVNSVQSREDFLNGLAGEYRDKSGEWQKAEDKGQAYRRFPFYLILGADAYEFGVDKGVLNGSKEYQQYIIYQNIRGNMQQIAQRCGNNYELYNSITQQALSPVIEQYSKLLESLTHEQRGTDAEILAAFADVGKVDDIIDTAELPF